MLHNSSSIFIAESTSRKFLDTLEHLLTSSHTSLIVRERVMDVLAAAAYASGSNTGFRGLWRRVKPRDKPEEGMPFDTEDTMFNPPLITGPAYDSNSTNEPVAPLVTNHGATPVVPLPPVSRPPPQQRKTSPNNNIMPGKSQPPKQHRSHKHRIISPNADMRLLFRECKIGVANAMLLSEALAMATPEQVADTVVIV
ncbi:hypothetical protein B0H19DRAFT_595190 [Mycena capillaripes]|nr:hypothetical protein B0H19DRAFT_595190 [Mycena capillaripes]